MRPGFTLIEVMVAMVCAGLVLAGAYGTWHALAGTHDRLERSAAEAQALRSAQALLADDLACATAAPRSADGAIEIARRDAAGAPGTATWRWRDDATERSWSPRGGDPMVMRWGGGVRLRIDDGQAVFEHAGRRIPAATAALADLRAR